MNNLPPAKRLLLFRTCQTETVLSRCTEKGNKRYNVSGNSDYHKQLAITGGDARAFILQPQILRLMHVEALTRLRGCTWSGLFFRLAPLLHPHPRDHFLAGLSASDFRKLRSPIAQWVKRRSADLAVPSSIPARGGNLVSRKRWMDV